MCLEKIIKDANDQKSLIEWLERHAPVWPSMLVKNVPGTMDIVLTTKVRIERDGKYYLVHHVQRQYNVVLGGNIESLYERMINQVHLCQVLYQITGNEQLEKLDDDQRPESERLKSMMPWLKS